MLICILSFSAANTTFAADENATNSIPIEVTSDYTQPPKVIKEPFVDSGVAVRINRTARSINGIVNGDFNLYDEKVQVTNVNKFSIDLYCANKNGNSDTYELAPGESMIFFIPASGVIGWDQYSYYFGGWKTDGSSGEYYISMKTV